MPSLQVTVEKTSLRGIVTQPDRPSGRGQKLQPGPVKAAAAQYDLPIFEPLALKRFAADQTGEAYDLFIVASYGRILPPELLGIPQLGSLNVHPSLLPRYRGATPIQAALRNGDAQTGVSIMLMDSGMDTGPLVLQEPVEISPQDDCGALHDRLAKIGARLLAHAIDLAAENNLGPYAQSGEPSVTRPLSKEDLDVDWAQPALKIVNMVRALSPEPAARTEILGVRLKLLRAKTGSLGSTANPGTVVESDRALLIACGEGAMELEEVIPESRGKMAGRQFKQWLNARQK